MAAMFESIYGSLGGGGCAKKPLSMTSITCSNATESDKKTCLNRIGQTFRIFNPKFSMMLKVGLSLGLKLHL